MAENTPLKMAQTVLDKQLRAANYYAKRDHEVAAFLADLEISGVASEVWEVVQALNHILYPRMMREQEQVLAEILRLDPEQWVNPLVWRGALNFHRISVEDAYRHRTNALFPEVWLDPMVGEPTNGFKNLGEVVQTLGKDLWDLRPLLWSVRDAVNAKRNAKIAERETTTPAAMLLVDEPRSEPVKVASAQTKTHRIRRGEKNPDWEREDRRKKAAYRRNLERIKERQARYAA